MESLWLVGDLIVFVVQQRMSIQIGATFFKEVVFCFGSVDGATKGVFLIIKESNRSLNPHLFENHKKVGDKNSLTSCFLFLDFLRLDIGLGRSQNQGAVEK